MEHLDDIYLFFHFVSITFTQDLDVSWLRIGEFSYEAVKFLFQKDSIVRFPILALQIIRINTVLNMNFHQPFIIA